MRAITPKDSPFVLIDRCSRVQISSNVARCLNDLETVVPPKVHGPFERPESHPRTAKLLPVLSRVLSDRRIVLHIASPSLPDALGEQASAVPAPKYAVASRKSGLIGRQWSQWT